MNMGIFTVPSLLGTKTCFASNLDASNPGTLVSRKTIGSRPPDVQSMRYVVPGKRKEANLKKETLSHVYP